MPRPCWPRPPSRPTGFCGPTPPSFSSRPPTGATCARPSPAGSRSDRSPASGPVKPGGDALTKHLRPVAALAVPLVVLDELHALLVLFRLQGEGTFGPAEV